MKKSLKLAWRNIWRNKRRTLITAASIFFSVLVALCMRSFQKGSYSHMINNVIESYIGYIQIQHKEFWDDKTLENSMEYSDELMKKIISVKNVKTAVPRIETMALASSGEYSKAAVLMCVSPQEENLLTKLENKLVKYKLTEDAIDKIYKEDISKEILGKIDSLKDRSYSNTVKMEIDLEIEGDEAEKIIPLITKHAQFESLFLEQDDNGVLIADRMAKYLKIGLGDTLVLIGQGYHGASAIDEFPVRGILKFPSPDMDKSMVYLTLHKAQDFLSVDNRITSIALNLNKHGDKHINRTVEALKENLDTDIFSVKGWKQLDKEMVQQIEADNVQGLIMLVILYIVIAFGILGTVLMMTAERKREFGVMVSVGMNKAKLAFIIVLEMIFLGLVGIVSGIIVSIPIILNFYYNPVRLTGEMAKTIENYGMEPVMPWAWQADYFINQSIVVIALIVFATIFPVIKVLRLKEVKALRG